MNAAAASDVRVLLHEAVMLHTLACALPLTAYRHPPMEFCRSPNSMERLAVRLDGIYTADQLRRRQRHGPR